MKREAVKRRHLLIAIALSFASKPYRVGAQQTQRLRVIGRLGLASTTLNTSVNEALRRGMHDLRYVEGRDFVIEFRTPRGQIRDLPRVAQELVALKVDVIVTGTDETTRAAQQ